MWTIIPSERRARVALALLLAVGIAGAPSLARADEPAAAAPGAVDPLDTLRERFREGMDKYKASAFAEAIVIWESIYRELGPDKGYRVAFDLARAYDQLGELIKAADHYETYLEKVAARRNEGETLEANVARQEEVARERLDKIAAVKGRIRVNAAAGRTVVVRVDNTPARVAGFILYVEPGSHTMTFGAGHDAETRTVTVAHGELVNVDPPPAPATTPEPSPTTRFETHVEHPFSPVVLWIGAGVAVASLLVPMVTYANALSTKSEFDNPATPAARKVQLRSDYDSARSNAYASIVVPAVFTAAVGGLAFWYVLGRKETRIPITPEATITPTAASVGLSGRF